MKTGLSWGWALVLIGLTGAADAQVATSESSCRSAYGDIWADDRSGSAIRQIDGDRIRSLSDLADATRGPASGVTKIKGGDFSGWDFTGANLSSLCFLSLIHISEPTRPY